MTPLEKIGLAALAVQDAIAHRSETRASRAKAFSLHGIDPATLTEEILDGELGELSDRYKKARRAVKLTRSRLRRLSVAYREAERRKSEQEVASGLRQIELFQEDSSDL